MIRTNLALLSALALAGCGGGAEAPATPPVAAAPGVVQAAAAAPAAPTVSPPGTLVPGALPSTVEVPAAPGVTFTVAQPGELQIDAIGRPMDAQLLLVREGTVVGEDSDSGEGADARLVTFLAPGTYEARVSEWRGRALDAQVQIQQLDPPRPVATVAPDGREVAVQVPGGPARREASAELTLVIRQAGTYRVEALSTQGEGRDAELMLILDGAVVGQDSDGGEGNDALLSQQLQPGQYRVRVRDWMNRAASIRVRVTGV